MLKEQMEKVRGIANSTITAINTQYIMETKAQGVWTTAKEIEYKRKAVGAIVRELNKWIKRIEVSA